MVHVRFKNGQELLYEAANDFRSLRDYFYIILKGSEVLDTFEVEETEMIRRISSDEAIPRLLDMPEESIVFDDSPPARSESGEYSLS